MKKLFANILLTAFLLQSFSQLYIITSFYIRQDYISKNLCVNRFDTIPVCKGQCYLAKELKESEKKQDQHSLDLKLKEIQLSQPVPYEYIYCLSTPLFHKPKPISKETNILISEFNFSVFHPPKIS